MGDLKEQMEKWKLSRYRQPMRETLEKMKEGYEGGVLSFLKKMDSVILDFHMVVYTFQKKT